MEIKLSKEEASILREVLAQMKIRNRTGELGILHGMDRFVSTNVIFKKQHLELFDSAAKKLGLVNGIKRTDS
jgi:hypothetical protein